MFDARVLHLPLGLLVGLRQRRTGAPLHGADRARRDRDPEQLVQQLPGLAAAQVIGTGEQHDHRGQARPEGKTRQLRAIVLGPCGRATTLALDLVSPPLRQMRPMVAQVELLVAARCHVRRAWQRVPAAEAHRRKQVDERIDRLRR